uniref:Uncharacterized protein n=1 Tax=Iridovirus LCIVAC01 TaxID=2506607 RepID=A0A481YR39_9VIRU|nr:MAG: hypothetical protein LCIVAC01_00040 [Iridovirus LCIVAC01]
MDRKQVYENLDTEREYQESLNPGWIHGGKPAVGLEILLAEDYLHLARLAWRRKYGDPNGGLDELRKVAGILVRCFENHGVPPRKRQLTVFLDDPAGGIKKTVWELEKENKKEKVK